ncbi:MAG: glycosyltransferase [bacterium]|nr:glycosyltransferase [bacterium]
MDEISKVCSVVVTYRRKELLREVLLAHLSQTRPFDKILVVDNYSNDGTLEMLASEFPMVEVLALPSNEGGASGFHHGVKWACEHHFDWIWLGDDDAIPHSNMLEEMLKIASFQKKHAVLGRVVNPDLTPQLRVLHYIQENDFLFKKHFHGLEPPELIYVANLTGFMVHFERIQKVGNIRLDFFSQCDDLEWSLRISGDEGIAYAREAIIVHKDHVVQLERNILGRKITAVDRNSLWKQYYGLRNTIIVYKMHHKPYLWHAFKVIAKNIIKRPLFGDNLLNFRIFWLAFWDGVHNRTGKLIPPGWVG